jgi:hypothetical protein
MLAELLTELIDMDYEKLTLTFVRQFYERLQYYSYEADKPQICENIRLLLNAYGSNLFNMHKYEMAYLFFKIAVKFHDNKPKNQFSLVDMHKNILRSALGIKGDFDARDVNEFCKAAKNFQPPDQLDIKYFIEEVIECVGQLQARQLKLQEMLVLKLLKRLSNHDVELFDQSFLKYMDQRLLTLRMQTLTEHLATHPSFPVESKTAEDKPTPLRLGSR